MVSRSSANCRKTGTATGVTLARLPVRSTMNVCLALPISENE